MPLKYLKNKLDSYGISTLNSKPILFRDPEDPSFCILKRNSLPEKTNHSHNLIWLTPEPLPWSKRKMTQTPHPLYFFKKDKKAPFIAFDRRYLKTSSGFYELPPLLIDLSTFFIKTKEIQELEMQLFGFQKVSKFYFKGETIDRLSHPLYLKALLDRQIQPNKIDRNFAYLFIKKFIDLNNQQ
jgi:hypothetical protein